MLERRWRASLALQPAAAEAQGPRGPYIPTGQSQPRYAGPRGPKGAYVSTNLAPRATPEPALAPVRVGGPIAHARGGAERP